MAALLALVCIQGLIGLGQGVASLIGAAKARETQEKAERVRNELREAKRIQMEQDAEHATALQTAMDDSATVQYNITTGLSTWQQQCKQLLPTFITACNTSGVIKAKSSRLQEIDKLFQEFDGCFKWMEKYLNIRGHSQAILAQKYWYFRRALNRLEQFVKKAKKLCTRCPSLAVSLNAILVIPEEQLRFFRHYCGLGSHAIKYPENINAYNHVMRRAISYTISDQPEPPMIQCKHDYVLTWLHFGSLGSTAHFKEGWLTLQSVAVTNRSPKVYVILKSQASKLLDGNQVEYRGHCAVIKYGPNLFVEVGCCGKKDHGFAIPDWLRNREFSDCCLVPSYDLSRALISCKYYVSIRHVKDQKVIDHYYGKRINSIHANCGNDYHQWRIKHIDGEWVVLINRQTNKVLDHYYSKSVQAYYSNENHPAHQWKFVPMGPKQFAIVNRNSGAALIRNSGDDGVIGANMVTPFEAWELIPA